MRTRQPRVTEATGTGFPSAFVHPHPAAWNEAEARRRARLRERHGRSTDLTVTPVRESTSQTIRCGARRSTRARAWRESPNGRRSLLHGPSRPSERERSSSPRDLQRRRRPSSLPFTTDQAKIDAALSKQPSVPVRNAYLRRDHSLARPAARRTDQRGNDRRSLGRTGASRARATRQATRPLEGAAAAARAAHVRIFAVGLKFAACRSSRRCGSSPVTPAAVTSRRRRSASSGDLQATRLKPRERVPPALPVSVAGPDKHIKVTVRSRRSERRRARRSTSTPSLAGRDEERQRRRTSRRRSTAFLTSHGDDDPRRIDRRRS